MRAAIASLFALVKTAAVKWRRDRAHIFAASLAYYSVFSLAPLVLFGVAVLSLRAGPLESRRFMLQVIDFLVGERGAEALEPIVASAGTAKGDLWATVLSFVTLLYGASTLFVHLQEALNVIFEAPALKRGWFTHFIRRRLLSFLLVLAVPFLLLAGPAMSAVFAYLGRSQGGSIAVSLAVETCLFAFIFKVLPDVAVPWDDVWTGSLFTASLFTLGQTLLGWYLNRVALRSVYGAAASLVALLVWIHVCAQILLFGAEVIHCQQKVKTGVSPEN